MAQRTKPKTDDRYVRQIVAALKVYEDQHPGAISNVYRYNSACVRIRVIDPAFQGMDWIDRETLIWRCLDTLPEDVRSEISMLVLVTPKETGKSLANLEFEHPSPSRL
jgi:hypothetical protein